jgi:hypothetical protein
MPGPVALICITNAFGLFWPPADWGGLHHLQVFCVYKYFKLTLIDTEVVYKFKPLGSVTNLNSKPVVHTRFSLTPLREPLPPGYNTVAIDVKRTKLFFQFLFRGNPIGALPHYPL